MEGTGTPITTQPGQLTEHPISLELAVFEMARMIEKGHDTITLQLLRDLRDTYGDAGVWQVLGFDEVETEPVQGRWYWVRCTNAGHGDWYPDMWDTVHNPRGWTDFRKGLIYEWRAMPAPGKEAE